MTIGASYLVFLERNPVDYDGDDSAKAGDLEIDRCGNWGLVRYSAKEIAAVQRLAARRR
jgi:hypothetical protein